MSNYREYIFTIGGPHKTRVYKGLRMSPKPDGFKFGFKFKKELENILVSMKKEDLQVDNLQMLASSLLEKIDANSILERWNFVLDNQEATIQANEDGSTETYVFSDEKMFNKWFSMYPEDLTEVMYTCIWENAAPFLPASWIKAKTEFVEAMKGAEVGPQIQGESGSQSESK